MNSRKPITNFALALTMALFAILPFRINPESFTVIDVAAVIIFGLVAAYLTICDVSGLRR